MATHYLSHISVGALDDDAIVESFLAEEASIPIWGPAALVAAGSGEYVARAGPVASAHSQLVVGVFVGPLRDAENGYVSTAAGQPVQVCTRGKCKVKVDGTDAIAVGDALVSHDTDGIAQLMAVATPSDWAGVITAIQYMMAGFAIALYASTADGDVIPCFVHGARGTET